jgi:hypothetical protein
MDLDAQQRLRVLYWKMGEALRDACQDLRFSMLDLQHNPRDEWLIAHALFEYGLSNGEKRKFMRDKRHNHVGIIASCGIPVDTKEELRAIQEDAEHLMWESTNSPKELVGN